MKIVIFLSMVIVVFTSCSENPSTCSELVTVEVLVEERTKDDFGNICVLKSFESFSRIVKDKFRYKVNDSITIYEFFGRCGTYGILPTKGVTLSKDLTKYYAFKCKGYQEKKLLGTILAIREE